MAPSRSLAVFILAALVSSGHADARQSGAYRYAPYNNGQYSAPAYPAYPHYPYAAMRAPHRNNPAYYPGHAGPARPMSVVAAPAAKPRLQSNTGVSRDSKLPAAKKPGSTTDNKQVFISTLLPHIEKENRRLLALRKRVESLLAKPESGVSLNKQDQEQIKALAKQYRVKADPLTAAAARNELLRKIDIIPSSLALAQAANESAWGQSRFAQEANNLFGIWTYDEDKGLVPRNRPQGKKHLVRIFEDFGGSVRYYIHLLNSHPAYAGLRKIREESRASGQPIDGYKLAAGLEKYSAKGQQYIDIIQGMIRQNKWAQLDTINHSA